MTKFFIHIADPGFPDPPWPGVRRLGPFDTRAEAEAQAVADAATGQGLALGIFTEEGSLAGAEALPDRAGPPLVSAEEISAAADAVVRETVAGQVQAQAENDAALQTLLDQNGITVAELRAEGLIS